MARLYSRKKGISRSKKPARTKKPVWQRYNKKEIEMLIVKLAKLGNTSSKIGVILRDDYGIPDVRRLIGKKINRVLKEQNLGMKLPEDLTALIRKDIKIFGHMENNKKDMPSKRGLQLTESKIKRLVKYYKKTGRLAKNWRFSREKAKLLLE